MLRHLPRTIAAARYFGADGAALARTGRALPPHPRQPVGLRPALSPALRADALAAMSPVKVSRRVRPDGATAQVAPL